MFPFEPCDHQLSNCQAGCMLQSWQTYIDDHLMVDLPHGGQLDSAAILGLDGGVWAQSPNFPELSEQEVNALVKGFEGKAGSGRVLDSACLATHCGYLMNHVSGAC